MAFGHVTLTNSLKFKGHDARVFGAAVILVAAYGYSHLLDWAVGYLPEFINGNEAFSSAFATAIGAFAVYVTARVMKKFGHKLRIPSVSVSIKRGRAA